MIVVEYLLEAGHGRGGGKTMAEAFRASQCRKVLGFPIQSML